MERELSFFYVAAKFLGSAKHNSSASKLKIEMPAVMQGLWPSSLENVSCFYNVYVNFF